MFASILTAAASFQAFLIPYVFNQGGPARANELIVVYGYREAFTFSQYGEGAAISLLAVAFIGAFMWLNVKKGRLADGVSETWPSFAVSSMTSRRSSRCPPEPFESGPHCAGVRRGEFPRRRF